LTVADSSRNVYLYFSSLFFIERNPSGMGDSIEIRSPVTGCGKDKK
jgi:hypothetical protein